MADLYRKNWAVLSGGFIAGDIYALNRFYAYYYRVFAEMINQNRIDDDQVFKYCTYQVGNTMNRATECIES